jgi:co-chaperonin GroES (HSP10)
MLIKGQNRYMVVELRDRASDSEDTIILLPDDYRPQESMHAVGVVKEAQSCSGAYEDGDVIVFPRHLLQEFDFKGETFYLVLENHILCSIEGE